MRMSKRYTGMSISRNEAAALILSVHLNFVTVSTLLRELDPCVGL